VSNCWHASVFWMRLQKPERHYYSDSQRARRGGDERSGADLPSGSEAYYWALRKAARGD